MKKFKYFEWADPYMGYGQGDALVYIKANTKKEAKEKLMKKYGWKNDPHFIRGDISEVKEFVQPKLIPII